MSVASNRIALAPIKESQLNSSPTSKVNTPKKKNHPSLVSMSKQPFAASLSRKKSDLITRSFTIAESATSLPRSFSPFQSLSFSDSRSTSTNPRPIIIKSNKPTKPIKNDTAGLAATKLKLKLQLALYKIQQSQPVITRHDKSNKLKVDETTTIKFNSATSLKILSPPSSAKVSGTTSPTRLTPVINPIGEFSYLPTPPEPINYASSININLETKTQLLASMKPSTEPSRPSLSKIANSKQLSIKKRNQKLKLYQIKKDSIFHTNNTQLKLPLVPGENTSKPLSTSSGSLDISAPAARLDSNSNMTSMIHTANSLIFPHAANSPEITDCHQTSPKAIEASSLPSILLNPPASSQAVTNNSTYLPSINKILRTPIKKASSTRYYQQSINSSARLSRLPTTSDDTTIDEDVDMTIINNTTSVEHNDTTIAEKIDDDDDDLVGNAVDEEDGDSRKKGMICSSPLPNHFGTPNRFSVAKSLLQLSGHQM